MQQVSPSNSISSGEILMQEANAQEQQHQQQQQLQQQQQQQQQQQRRYGWGSFRPHCLQRINNPFFFMLCLSSLMFGQGLVCTGIANTVITSVEKRYGFTSTQIGLFKSCFHIAAGLFNTVVCYFGHRHRPLTLAIGCVLISLGNFIVTISHYISPPYEAGVSLLTDTCRVNTTEFNSSPCLEATSPQNKHVAIFVVGYCIIGLGVTPLYSLSYAHLDDITPRGKNSLYIGIVGTVSVIGPAGGFLLANPLLKIYVDITQPAGSSLTPQSQNWVGAWWIGYLVGAGLLLFPAILMFGFPPLFPNSEELKEKKRKLQDTIAENEALKHDVKSVWPATKALLTNVPFLFTCLASAAESLLIGGFSVFLPKFLETQFHLTAARSALYTGSVLIPGAAGGMFLGGFLVKRFGWNCKQTLRGATIMAFLSFLFTASTLIGCSGRNVIGADVGYYNSSITTELINQCNEDCHCSRTHYKPVCSVYDQNTFFSACHAGCSSDAKINGKYSNCSCLPSGSSHVIEGGCKSDCQLLPVFFILSLVFNFFVFMNYVPMLNVVFRTVPEGQGSFAMGFQQVFSRFLGFVPAPMMFGRLIDESCKLWNEDACTGQRTSCLEYDSYYFRCYLFALCIGTKFLSLMFIFGAYKTYHLPAEHHSDKPKLDGPSLNILKEQDTTLVNETKKETPYL